ncbi:cyclase family protein [Aurantiacibacter zhengii]|uniref:Cyclase family protein n=1 Tax=Aurantiacibacter zhengii TaxID=2307003 RepID=A0A418NTL4_9SPHN|nr:cyclase family protein [Aurantiacibacter zhengii]RIV86807.1 cyclase family protein [Aurantiacibacter zhengii]
MCEHDHSTDHPSAKALLDGLPMNWGKWGPDDEVGSLNYLDPSQVMRGVGSVRSGKVFTLQIPMGHEKGDPIWPGRKMAQRYNVLDKGDFLSGKMPEIPGGTEYSDDMMILYLQGSTQYDALGHVWHDDKLYNGFDARSTIGSMAKASVFPIAERGVVGRAVLVDIARLRGKDWLDRAEPFGLEDILAAAEAQGVTIEKRDILIIRTGWIGSFYKRDQEEFYGEYAEPGLDFSRELVEWFHEMEIPNLVTDTIANELAIHPSSGVSFALHHSLMRGLGVTFTEIAQLDPLADDCAEDGQWNFLYTAAPLKVVGGTGAPVNPVVIK